MDVPDEALLELARERAARWSVENDGITGHCVFAWRKYLETARAIIKLNRTIEHALKKQKESEMANELSLADAVFSACENAPLHNTPFMADRLGLAAALEALAVNADWEAEDPKFMVLRIAEQIKNGGEGLK